MSGPVALRRATLAVALAAFAVLLPAGVATAACGAAPSVSPSRFTGLVTQLKDGGALAVVRRDDGATVVVRAGTGEDRRTFQTGARYEFHPFNAASPYDDNGCSATRQIAPPDENAVAATGQGGSSLAVRIGALVVIVAALLSVPRIAARLRRLGGSPGAR